MGHLIMVQTNPFASPQAELQEVDHYASGTVWRLGTLLVMQKGAELPWRCVVTGGPAAKTARYTLVWQPKQVMFVIIPVIALVVLIFSVAASGVVIRSPLVLTILQVTIPAGGLLIALTHFLTQRKATVHVPVCHRVVQLRRLEIFLQVSGGLVVLAGIRWQQPLAIAAGALLLVLTRVALAPVTSTVKAALITKKYVYLKKVHPDYLRDLPEWPHPERL